MASTLKLLSTGNPKTLKGEKQGYITYILHLAPADVAGVGNMCPKSTVGCRLACLNTAGQGGMFKPGQTTNHVQEARKRKTVMWVNDRAEFIALLKADIARAIKQAAKKAMIPVFSLNGTSDIAWEKYGIIQEFADVQFYDYTKILGRKTVSLPNYHLTFSQADGNEADVEEAVRQGYNIATVFRKVIPDTWMGLPVVDGDEDDLRFLNQTQSVIGLKAKGRARKDTSGFVVDISA